MKSFRWNSNDTEIYQSFRHGIFFDETTPETRIIDNCLVIACQNIEDALSKNKFECYYIVNRHVQYQSNIRGHNIISPFKQEYLSAHTIYGIPVKGCIYYVYLTVIERIISNNTVNYKSTLTDSEYSLFNGLNLFSKILTLLEYGHTDMEIAWLLTNHESIKITSFYHISEANSNYVKLTKNGAPYTVLPNYFIEMNPHLWEMRFTALFYRDGVPIETDKVFINNGIFPTPRSTTIMKFHRNPNQSIANSVAILNWNQKHSGPKISFGTYGDIVVRTYLASYDYVTLRVVHLQGLKLPRAENIPFRTYQVIYSDILRLYKKFGSDRLYFHNISNWLNNMCAEYTLYLINNSEKHSAKHSEKLSAKHSEKLSEKLSNPNQDRLYKMLGFGTGMFWSMIPKMYLDVQKVYGSAIECFASERNHILDSYCSIIDGRSFFDQHSIEEQCLLINPPFTEKIIYSLFHKVYELLTHSSKKKVAFIFFALWYDIQPIFQTYSFISQYIVTFPDSIAYDYSRDKLIRNANIKQQVFFCSNRTIDKQDMKALMIISDYMNLA